MTSARPMTDEEILKREMGATYADLSTWGGGTLNKQIVNLPIWFVLCYKASTIDNKVGNPKKYTGKFERD